MGLIPYKNEVYLDWSEEKNVEAMRAALREVGSRLDRSYPAIIGGRRVETDGEIVSVNPADPSQVVGRTARATEREADMALETATSAFETWSRTSPEARARILLRASAIMKRRRFELLAWEAYEGGKPWAEADAQVAEAIDFLEYYSREMLRLKDGLEIYSIPGEESRYTYQPMGVGVIIAPWNFPTAILTGMSSAAIVAGNTVIMKPSEFTSVIGAVVAEIFEEAGLPEGVLNFLPGYGSEVGDYLVEDARTRFISFTGSMKTGLRINELAARQIGNQRWVKRVIAEMGGKDAMISEDPGDPGKGYFVSPTLFEVDPKARVAQEEIFGPVLSVIQARDFEDALRIANDNPYGLTGGVYSKNRDHLELARHEFNAGNVYFNRKITGALVGVQPFGGFGMSGTDSKAGGPDYLPLHMLAKTVVERF